MPKIDISKKTERQNLIISHAMDLFAVKGYAITSMDDIARSAGMSKGGVYVYFSSKEEIFMAIAEMVTHLRHQIVAQFPPHLSNREKLENYIKQTISGYMKEENFKRIRFTFEFWIQHYESQKIGSMSKVEFIHKKFTAYEKDLKEILVAGINSGEFKENIDIESLPYIILTSIDGMAFAASALANPLTRQRINTFAQIIINSVLKNQEPRHE